MIALPFIQRGITVFSLAIKAIQESALKQLAPCGANLRVGPNIKKGCKSGKGVASPGSVQVYLDCIYLQGRSLS